MSKQEKQEKKKKKHTALIIILIVVGVILLTIAGIGLMIYLKLAKMSRNATPIDVNNPLQVPEVIEQPEMDLIPVEDYSKIDLTEDYDIDIEDIDIGEWGEPTNEPIQYTPHHNSNIINILLVGNDQREGQHDHGRSDTMILLSFNRTARTAKLVSFLRDTWVYIPGRNKWNRINTAYFFGGIGMMINTINYNFNLDIQKYMRVDFNNLRYIVDSLGGIDIYLTEREIDYINANTASHLPREAGIHHLNGLQTLRHARNRSIGGDGDWSRTRRQRDILYAMLNKIKQQPSVYDLYNLVDSMLAHVETNLTPGECADLAGDFIFGNEVMLANRAVPFEGTWQYAWEGRMAVIKIDIAANRAKLHQYLYGG